MGVYHKNILIGVTGGIAAYKSAELVGRFKEVGAQVKVIMTPSANDFITPLTLSTLSGFPVYSGFKDPEQKGGIPHIDLARWADAILVAPATANYIAKLASGFGDDLLSALTLARSVPLAVAPAMNKQMWENAFTQENISRLKAAGIHVFGPIEGQQACGEFGFGKMMEPADILLNFFDLFKSQKLLGKTVVITAGPTYEPIDAVRYIGNRSSGKMGYALAQACQEAGAKVILVSGPSAINLPKKVDYIRVETADQMFDAVIGNIEGCDLFIGCAAVADYKAEQPYSGKLKKTGEGLDLKLVKNRDIIATVAALDRGPVTIGFAAEVEEGERYAREKLESKKLDMIVLNEVQEGKGFGQEDNELTVFTKTITKKFPLARKNLLARELVELIASNYFLENDQANDKKLQCTTA